MKRVALFLALLMSLAAPALAGFNEGLEAHERGDYATALKEWRPLAEKGLAKAQYKLGFMYEWGQGVTQRYAKAVRWYHKAAEQGDLDAQNTLGKMYMEGRGLPPDFAEAVRWNRKAAEQGSAAAMSRLTRMYFHGEGRPPGYVQVQQDLVHAYMWLNLLAVWGDEEAVAGWLRLAAVWGDEEAFEMYILRDPRLSGGAVILKAQRLAREWLEALGPDHPKMAELRRLQLADAGKRLQLAEAGEPAGTSAGTPGCLAGATFGPIPEDSPWFGRVEGVQVVDVEPDSLASQMGLRKHALVVVVNGQQVRDLDEFVTATRKLGGSLTLGYRHSDGGNNEQMIAC